MRRLLFFLICLLLAGVSGSQAQNYTLTISPASGAPGTTVTLSPNPTYNDERCFANGTPISRMYTVPNSASGTIMFYCEAGTGEFYSRTNDTTFTVTAPDSDGDGIPDDVDQCPNQPAPNSNNGCPPQQPPSNPVDSDGDGIPDDVDQCPNQPAPNSNNGCPPQQPPSNPVDSDGDGVLDDDDTCPAEAGLPEWNGCPDSDGDGLTTQYDNCPNQAGSRENLGCPEGESAAPAQPSPPPVTQLPLPVDGQCYVATAETGSVNVRSVPGLDGEIVGALNPSQVYRASLRFRADDDAIWYWINDFSGWVAGFVLRISDPCGIIPFGSEDGELDMGDIQLASLDLNTILADCPDLIDSVRDLPLHVQNYIISHDNPCDAARNLLDTLFAGGIEFNLPNPNLPQETVNTLLENCVTRTPNLFDQLSYLLFTDREIYQSRYDAIVANNCDVGLWDGIPEPVAWGLNSDDGLGYVLVAHCERPLLERGRGIVADDEGAIYNAFPGYEWVRDPNNHPIFRTGMLSGCGLADVIINMGELSPEEIQLASAIQFFCQIPYQPDIVAVMYAYSIRLIDAREIVPVAPEDRDAFCDNPARFILSYEEPPGTYGLDGSEVPFGMERCPELAFELKTYRDDSDLPIRLDDLLGIMLSDDLCAAARQFLRRGSAPDVPQDLYDSYECVVYYGDVDDAIYLLFGYDEDTASHEDTASRRFDRTAAWTDKMYLTHVLVLDYRDGFPWEFCSIAGANEWGGFNELFLEELRDLHSREKTCRRVRVRVRADTGGINPRGGMDYYVDVWLVGWGGPPGYYPRLTNAYRQTPRPGEFTVEFYTMFPSGVAPSPRLSYQIPGGSAQLVEVERGNGFSTFFSDNNYAGRIHEVDRRFCETGTDVERGPVRGATVTIRGERDDSEGDVGSSRAPLRDEGEGDVGASGEPIIAPMGIPRADDRVARIVTEADFVGMLLTDPTIPVYRVSFDDVTDDDATRERIRARDLTDDEIRLLDLITVNCGLSWEVGGREVIEYLQLDGDLPAFIELAESDIHAFCESVQYLTDNLETNAAGELVLRDPPPESDDGSRLLEEIIIGVDVTTETARIERGELNDRERDVRTIIETRCGISREPDGREIMIYLVVSRLIDDTLARDAEDSESLCEDLNRLAFILGTDTGGRVVVLDVITPDEPILTGTESDGSGEPAGTPGVPVEDTPSDTGDSASGEARASEGLADASTLPDGEPAGTPGVPVEDTLSDTGDSASGEARASEGLADASILPDGEPAVPDAAGTIRTPEDMTQAIRENPLQNGRALLDLEQNGMRQIYVLNTDDMLIPLLDMPDVRLLLPAMSPENDRVLFLAEDDTGAFSLYMLNTIELDEILIGLTIGVDGLLPHQPVWMPDGERILLTATGDGDTPGIYEINLTEQTSRRIVDSAFAPTVNRDGRILAFVRDENGLRNIYSLNMTTPNATPRPVTQPGTENDCVQPQFGDDLYTLYFQCEETLYRYGLQGLEAIYNGQLNTYAPAGQDLLLLSNDDGLFMLDENSGQLSPSLTAVGQAQSMTWLR